MPDPFAQPSGSAEKVVYVYIIIGVLATFLVITSYGYFCRVAMSRRQQRHAAELARKKRARPECHDVWLSAPAQECAWRDIQPLSIEKVSDSMNDGYNPPTLHQHPPPPPPPPTRRRSSLRIKFIAWLRQQESRRHEDGLGNATVEPKYCPDSRSKVKEPPRQAEGSVPEHVRISVLVAMPTPAHARGSHTQSDMNVGVAGMRCDG